MTAGPLRPPDQRVSRSRRSLLRWLAWFTAANGGGAGPLGGGLLLVLELAPPPLRGVVSLFCFRGPRGASCFRVLVPARAVPHRGLAESARRGGAGGVHGGGDAHVPVPGRQRVRGTPVSPRPFDGGTVRARDVACRGTPARDHARIREPAGAHPG